MTTPGTRMRPREIRAVMLDRQERFRFVGSQAPVFVENCYTSSSEPLWNGRRSRSTLPHQGEAGFVFSL